MAEINFLNWQPYGLPRAEKQAPFRTILTELTQLHRERCAEYRRYLTAMWRPPTYPPYLATPWRSVCWQATPTWCGYPAAGGETDAVLLTRLARVLDRPEHSQVKARLAVVSYGRDDAVTAGFCAKCDARMVWGGDATVAALRAMPMPPHAVEFSFPDRWSLALFSQAAFSAMDGDELAALARRFYNDTYQMDQNACSSPQLVLWLEDGGTPDCRRRWWLAVAEQAVQRYDLGFYQAARKKELLCRCAMTMDDPPIASVERYAGNLLYVACLHRLPADPTGLRGGFGLFFQSAIPSLEALLPLLTPKVQTLVCGGLEPEELAQYLARHGAGGVDRVVRLGQALELDTIWDGKDLIAGLSRGIAWG